MYQTEHLDGLAQAHLICQDTAQTVLLLYGKVEADLTRIQIDIEPVLTVDHREQLVLSISCWPSIFFPQRVH